MIMRWLLGSIFAIFLNNNTMFASEYDQFTVTKVISGCKYFMVKTPVWEVIAESWMCSKPSVGDTGTGDLIGYFAKPVKLNGTSCDLWVETWGSSSTVEDRLADKCEIK
jgi:hypothetical protein